jgi:hypothetical protein
MPTIDLTDDELATVVAAIKRAIEQDRFPRAPRLDPLRSALAKLDPAAAAALMRPLTAKNAKPAPQTAHNPKRPPTSLLRRSAPHMKGPAHVRQRGRGRRQARMTPNGAARRPATGGITIDVSYLGV